MYIFGKKNRSFMHRYDMLKILGLTDKPVSGEGDALIGGSRAGLRGLKVREENVAWNERQMRGGGVES